jgi:hypothetical protein
MEPMFTRLTVTVVAVLVLGSGCQLLTPDRQFGQEWPPHDGLVCVEVPHQPCRDMADLDLPHELAAGRTVRGVTIVCTRPEGCTHLVGAGETVVHYTDGSTGHGGWGYGTAAGPPPAPPPGWRPPRGHVEIDCIGLAPPICDAQVDAVFLDIHPGAAEPVSIRVVCEAVGECTEHSAEGTIDVLYSDGSHRAWRWGFATPDDPPAD